MYNKIKQIEIMRTINSIKSQFETKIDKDGILSSEELLIIDVKCFLMEIFRDSVKQTGVYTEKGLLSIYHTNEEILNTLRQLYVATTNNFVKQVVKTVGQSKTFTNKQLDIITDELVKYNTITINF